MPKSPIPLNPFASSPTTRTRWIPAIESGMRSSFEKMKKDLRLGERARSSGEENLPTTDDLDLDEPQRQVRAHTQAGVNLLKQFLANQLHGAEAKVRALRQRSLASELALAAATSDAAKAKQAAADDLESARLAERMRLRGWRKFRRDNGLSRKADYADARALPAVIIAAMVVMEGLVNAYLFMNATEGGLAAGAFLAVVCSVINVALGFLAGFVGLRLLSHVRIALKVTGGVTLLAFILAGGEWNLAIARFRDDLAAGGEASLAGAAASASVSWLATASPEAIGLLFLGAMIFLAAMLKGRGGHGGFTDTYWGYRPVDRDRRVSEDDYKRGKDTYRAQVAAAYEKARVAVRRLHEASRQELQIARETLAEAEERAAEVRDSIGEWIRDGGSALRFYREENRAVRTLPAPAYFDIYPSFSDMADGLADTAALKAAIEAAEAAHLEADRELAEFEAKLTARAQAETDAFLKEVAEIEAKVEERLRRDFSERERPIDDPAAERPALRGVA